MDNPEARKIVQPSAGIHIVLPEYYSPRNMGLLDPSTSDGRVIFFLPWQGKHSLTDHESWPQGCVHTGRWWWSVLTTSRRQKKLEFNTQ